MKTKHILNLSILASLLSLSACAAIPLSWEVETSRANPVQFEQFSGAEYALKASFKTYGTPFEITGTPQLFWQTNGMGTAWWTAPATASGNVIRATWTPAYETGANAYTCFLGVTGTVYNAAFTLRLRRSPGATPNELPIPTPFIDCAKTVFVNPESTPFIPLDGSSATTGFLLLGKNKGIKYVSPSGRSTNYLITTGLSVPINMPSFNGRAIQANMIQWPDDFPIKIEGKTSGKCWAVTTGQNGLESNLIADGSDFATSNMVNAVVAPATNATLAAATSYAGANFIAKNTNPTLGTTTGNAYLRLGYANANESQLTLDQYGYATRYKRDGTADDEVNLFWIAATAQSNYTARTALETSNAQKLSRTEAAATYYPKALGDAWSSYWDGDEVRVTITNYFGALDLPHLYIEQRTNTTGSVSHYRTVWDEMTRWNAFEPWKTNVAARIASLEANKADRAWGFYDSSSGSYAPDGFASVSQSNILVSAGLAYQRTVTTSGDEYWVLTATEPTTANGLANGAFQVKDSDGNVQIELIKGDKRTVGARCNSVSVSGRVLQATYNVASATHPTVEVCADLASPTFVPESSANCPATVTWTGSSGAWVAHITPVSASATKIFAKASYEVGGDDMFYSHVAIKASRLIIGNTTYTIGTATVSGHTVLTLTPAN